MLMNQKMSALYSKIHIEFLNKTGPLSENLRNLINSDLIKTDGCTFFTVLKDLSPNATLKSFTDLTGYECFVNHIHLEDYIETSHISLKELLRAGIIYVRGLYDKLLNFSPDEHYRIILSVSHSDIDSDVLSDTTEDRELWLHDDLNEYGNFDCNVRFHMIRNGESWLSDDLNKYKDEALLVLDT